MAYAITNKQFASPSAAWIPALHVDNADKTASITGVNTGVVGNKWMRVRVYVKTFGTLAAADTLTVQVQVGVTSTPNEVIAYEEVLLPTNCTALVIDLFGASELGFQYYEILFTASSSHSFTADVMVDIA